MSLSLEIEAASKASQNVNRASWTVFVLVFVPTCGSLVVATVLNLPAAALFAFPIALGLGWFVRSPVVGFYALFAAALTIGVQPMPFASSISDVPFWLNLSESNSLNLAGFGTTPAEILMLATFIGLIGTLAVTRTAPPAGRLMVPYLVFAAVVLIGEVNGLVHGGDFKLSLWELRPQVYGLAAFIMATVLIRDRSQLKVLLVILLVAEVLKASEGAVRYFVILKQTVNATLETNLAHEDSYLLALFLLAVVIGLIWFRRPATMMLVALSPLVFIAIVVNQRRAGLLGLGLDIMTVMVFAYIVEPRLRGVLLKVGIVMAVLTTTFVVAFWNQQSGAIGELIRPIKSLVDPSARDLASNLYRIAESANLRATFRTAPLFGIGFGHPYDVFYPQTGVSKFDPLWNIIPHNTILWIPMRMGIVGVVSFWCLISMAIVEAIWTIRNVKDKFVRAAVLFALAAIFGDLFMAYLDVALEIYRNMVVLGVLLAVISRATYLAREEEPKRQPVAPTWKAPVFHPLERANPGPDL